MEGATRSHDAFHHAVRIIMPSGGITVLVVDDDDEFRIVLGEILAAEGCRVAHARNGAEALHVLGSLTPDLLIVDLAMPVMSGVELLDRLARDERLAGIPVAVASSWDPPEDVFRGRVVRKPLDLPNLLGVLAAVDCAAESR
jgi:two-component system, chemotaxis family, chemotaxis protein CheY